MFDYSQYKASERRVFFLYYFVPILSFFMKSKPFEIFKGFITFFINVAGDFDTKRTMEYELNIHKTIDKFQEEFGVCVLLASHIYFNFY